MKQLLSLFLFLLPCLAWAQYPSNGNQKITLGEQTTADGLIFRGVLGDTALITPLSDTSAYIILDTANHRFYNYNRATNVWSVAGGGTAVTTFSGGTTGLTPNTATSGAVTLGGTLAVANGGTGSATQNFVDLTTTQSSIAGAKTFTSALTATRFNPTATTVTGNGMYLPATNTLGFSTNGTNRMTIDNRGNIGIVVTPNTDINTLNNGIQFPQGGSFLARNDLPILFFGSNIITNETATVRQVNGRGARLAVNAYNDLGYDFWVETVPNGTAGTSGSPVRKIALSAGGQFGIGDNIESTEKLDVDGNARIRAVGAGTFSNNLNITSTGVLTTETSDAKYKYNIRPLNYGLETLLQLNPVNFQWIKGEEEDLGFIAQDVAEIIPEAVNTNWNSDLLFRYESLIPILTKAIQEQQTLIKALEQRIINLENK